MDTAAYIDALESHGLALADAAEHADLGKASPDCPPWTARDVVEHIAEVHRWAVAHIRDGMAASGDSVPTPAIPDADLIAYFRTGHADLVTALREAPDDLEATRFLRDAPPARTFWARRQAHETAIHRSDVAVAGGTPPDYDPAFATDGIDELLVGFLSRRKGRLVSPEPCTLGVRTTDTGGSWLLTIRPDARDTRRGEFADADCTITGPAASVYPFLWNRTVTDPPAIEGDVAVHELWRALAQVHWS